MKSKIAAFAMMFMAVFTLASCLNDDSDYTYTDDCAITSFSVTGAKRYIHTKTSKGDADSVYAATTSLTSYRFCIDQNRNIIYNPDSLPCGTDAKKLVCTIGALNSATVYMKDPVSGALNYVSSSDSLDFSQSRELQVSSNSGAATRTYRVTVNVHKEQADSFFWANVSKNEQLLTLRAAKTYAVTTAEGKARLFLFGSDGTHTYVYVMNDGKTWTIAAPNFNTTLDADAWQGVVVKDEQVYISLGGRILRTTDGSTWQEMSGQTDVTRLVAASPIRLYGYTASHQLMASTDNGKTWTAASLDSDAALLPTGDVAYTCTELRTNANNYRVTLYGTTATGEMSLWGKVDESGDNSENQPWTYYNVSADNHHALPSLKALSTVVYDGKIYALGTPDDKHEDNAALYCSRDGGLTWKTDSTVTLPTDLTLGTTLTDAPAISLTVDCNHFLWLVNTKNGTTWRGRINRLGWAKEPNEYTE